MLKKPCYFSGFFFPKSEKRLRILRIFDFFFVISESCLTNVHPTQKLILEQKKLTTCLKKKVQFFGLVLFVSEKETTL
jgi:hypothetical protein